MYCAYARVIYVLKTGLDWPVRPVELGIRGQSSLKKDPKSLKTGQQPEKTNQK